MEFYDVVGQVLELLQRQKRVSYRALKRQFSIDDDYIEDLKEELLFSHPVVDEDGRGLVWTGNTDATPVAPSQPNQSESQPIVEQTQPHQETPSPVEPHAPDAERRQLTVMFVDLVDSTRLSSELDPEDYREIVREYQQSCSEVVAKYAGNIAQYLGDGLLVYFGYPIAHEDDPQRSVRSGLEIVKAIHDLNIRLEQNKGVKLAVRLGIHTGLVVVGEMGSSGRQEQLALGETPNIQRGIAANRTYIFKHTLVQDIAYESLLRRTRQEHHRRIAKVVEEQFSEIAENQPELLAYHYIEAGLNQESAIYWYQAGKRAIERSAHTEAITHFNQGLELLNTLPEALERNQQELEILVSLGPALIVLKGYGAPEVGRAYARAQEICQQLGDNPQTFQVLWGLRAFYYLRAELQRALELGGQLLRLAQRHDNFGYLLEAHRSLGTTSFNMGELQSAHHHLRQVIDLYDPQHHHAHTSLYGQDPGMVSLTYMAMTLWILGYPVQALQKSSEALDPHQQISHSYSLVFILTSIARLHQFCREGVLVQERIEISLALCSEHGFGQFLAQGKILRGWGLAMKGEFEDGINQIEEGFSAYRATGGALTVPYWLALLADAYGRKGQPEVALDQLGEGLTVLDKTGERFYESEIHRLKGSLLLQQSPDNAAEAESYFQQAISIAQNQSAKSWELRAATSLAKLWQSQGKRQKAYDLLAPVYGWFTEGFDTADLIDAKALLDELA